jgi:20S proteasome subunit alpha 6
LCDHNQAQTQKEGKRPTGVGLLIAGYDQRGPHLFESLPNAEYNEYLAQAIGSRCQSAITYLEKNQKKINSTATVDELIQHIIYAVRVSYEDVLSSSMISIGVVGKNQDFTIYDFDDKLINNAKNDASKVFLDKFVNLVENQIIAEEAMEDDQ